MIRTQNQTVIEDTIMAEEVKEKTGAWHWLLFALLVVVLGLTAPVLKVLQLIFGG